MKNNTLELSKIHCDSGTQSRLQINEEVVCEYADRITAGDAFPPMDVFHDGTDYHLADGFHRYMAARRNGLKQFECVVHVGTATDALWFALGANRKNGARMNSADKRRAIELALVKFPDKTQEAIAEHVGCCFQYVSKVQNELSTSGKLNVPKTRKGKDGKIRKTKYATKPKITEQPSPEPDQPAPGDAKEYPADWTEVPINETQDEPEQAETDEQPVYYNLSDFKTSTKSIVAEYIERGDKATLIEAAMHLRGLAKLMEAAR